MRKHTTIFYCTHILDDVQRVSDTVAILNKGRLVANGPIAELLAGGEGAAYNVKIRGNAESAWQRLVGQPWVAGIQTQSRNGTTAWTVAVSDETAAEAHLLRLLLADEHLAVTEFGRKQYELEDVFVQIVEGGPDVKRK